MCSTLRVAAGWLGSGERGLGLGRVGCGGWGNGMEPRLWEGFLGFSILGVYIHVSNSLRYVVLTCHSGYRVCGV